MSIPDDQHLTNSLPTKSRSLRARSIAKRLETERNKNAPRVRKPRQKVSTMSKYRRKTANAKERDRMKQVNDAFEKLREVVPHHRAFFGPSNPPSDGGAATKVSTLRCAISYINSLQQLIRDSNMGLLDPNLYNTDLHDEDVFLKTKKSSKPPKKTGKQNSKKKNKGKKTNSKSLKPASPPKKRKPKTVFDEECFSKIRPLSTATMMQENLFSSSIVPQPTLALGSPHHQAAYVKDRNPLLLPLQPLFLPTTPPNKAPATDSLYGEDSDASSASPGSASSSSLDILLQPLDFSSTSHPEGFPCGSSSNILDDIQQILKDAENFDIMV